MRLVLFIGTTLAAAQIAALPAQTGRADLAPVGREASMLREHLERALDPESAAHWSRGWRLAEGLGAVAFPTLRDAWNGESRRERRLLWLTAAIRAAGDRAVARMAPGLAALPRAQADERVCALLGIALAGDQVVEDAAALGVLSELATSSSSSPMTVVTACLALWRTDPRLPTSPGLQRLLRSKDPGVAAAIRVAWPELGLETGGPRNGTNGIEGWLRSARAGERHTGLVLRAALLAVGRQRAPLRDDLLEYSWPGSAETPTAVHRCAALAVAGSPVPLDAATEELASFRSVPDAQVLAALCSTAGGRAFAARRGWLQPVPPGRGTTQRTVRARVSVAWVLAAASADLVPGVRRAASDTELRESVGLTLALRLVSDRSIESPTEADCDELLRAFAGTPAAPWIAAAVGREVVVPPASAPGSDSLLATAARALSEGQLTRAGAVRALEDAMWRLQVHPGRARFEEELTWIADLMIVGSNSGAASLGVVPEVRRAAYLPEGIDATADRVFTLLAEMWKDAWRAGDHAPERLRIVGGS